MRLGVQGGCKQGRASDALHPRPQERGAGLDADAIKPKYTRGV